jgi:preprotein translocase subunit SecD
VVGANQLKGDPEFFPVDSVDGFYTEEMNTRFAIHAAVLAVAMVLLAGCSGADTVDTGLPGKSLQLRLVVSSVDGACSAPALSSAGPASACDRAGVTTYELAKSLGVVTPTSVVFPENEGSENLVILELNKADTSTLGNVSREAIDQHLAIVLDGRVLSAPLVKNPLTTSELTLMFGTASEAKQVAADLGASAAP